MDTQTRPKRHAGEHAPAGIPIVVMGVCGSGKSTLGALLGERLGMPFIDGDDLHPAGNKEKMRAGLPLNDDDRRPWLTRIGQTISAGRAGGHPPIIACSALKRSYLDLLRGHVPDLVFIHPDGDAGTIGARLAVRRHDYMPPDLLASQLAALEPLEPDERHLMADLRRTPDEMVETILAGLGAAHAGRNRADAQSPGA